MFGAAGSAASSQEHHELCSVRARSREDFEPCLVLCQPPTPTHFKFSVLRRVSIAIRHIKIRQRQVQGNAITPE